MWSETNRAADSKGLLPFRETLGPLFLLLTTPVFAVVLAYYYVVLEGSIPALVEHFSTKGAYNGIAAAFYPPTWTSTAVIGCFMAFELLLMKLPGKKVKGPITANGHVPEYTANGFPAFLITLSTWFLATHFGLFPATIVYDNFCAIISSLCVFALLFCLLLYFKGLYFPSTPDSGSSGNPIVDYWWGTELYPNILGFDVKMFTNCRFGMNAWYLIVLSYAAKNAELNGGQVTNAMLVCASLITIYLGKFFWWEMGYMQTIDIAHDRSGYYICWGCLVWVPALYTSPGLSLVQKRLEDDLSIEAAIAIFLAGIACIYLNYAVDAQRMEFRRTSGKTKICFREPKFIRAKFTAGGKQRESLLLSSGWWGMCRKINYVFEWGAAFCWSVPNGFSAVAPYSYFIFLVILLVDRAARDDKRCSDKYGKYWDEYCKEVPYMIVPFIYQEAC